MHELVEFRRSYYGAPISVVIGAQGFRGQGPRDPATQPPIEKPKQNCNIWQQIQYTADLRTPFYNKRINNIWHSTHHKTNHRAGVHKLVVFRRSY